MPWREVLAMAVYIETSPDPAREDELTDRLVEHNLRASDAIRRRFAPEHLPSRPVMAFAVGAADEVVGGCVASTVDVWHWLTIDTMWVHPSHRGEGLGRRLLES